MIDELDEAFRQLLMRDLPIKNNEIDIAFDQPKRDWSARVSRPTLNLFMYDLRENLKLRASHPVWENIRDSKSGATVQKRRPMRVDIRYLVTAWTAEAEDEHRLLTRAMLALIRYPNLPPEVLPDILQTQPVPIPIQVAQPDTLPNASEIWSSLENTMRPTIVLQATLALDPYVTIPAGPPVRTREVRMSQAERPASLEKLVAGAGVDTYWSIGGTLRARQGALVKPHLKLVERDEIIPVNDQGRFAIGHLQAGEYTLSYAAEGREMRRQKITVPAPDYDLEI